MNRAQRKAHLWIARTLAVALLALLALGLYRRSIAASTEDATRSHAEAAP